MFIAPALAAFSLFSLYDFYFALAPALLKESLHIENLATGGGALCYRGSFQIVNKIAPADQRAEVTSSYFPVSFLGNSLPIIGVALLGALIGSTGAYEVFGAIVALIAIAALLPTLFSREYRAS